MYENVFSPELCDNIIARYERTDKRIKGNALFREQVEEIEIPSGYDPTDPDFLLEDYTLWEGVDETIEKLSRQCLDLYMQHYFLQPYEYEYIGCKMLFYPPHSFSPMHYDDELVANDGGNIGSARPIIFLIYLNDNFEAGETIFPQQELAIKPKKGAVTIFPASYMYPHTTNPTEGNLRYVLLPFYRKTGLNEKIRAFNSKQNKKTKLVNKLRTKYSPESGHKQYAMVEEVNSETKR